MTDAPADRDLDLYDYNPYNARPKLTWPNGARLALWIAPNFEFYELDPPPNPHRKPWPRPTPDVVGYSWRDYGNRAGIWRFFEVMDQFKLRGSVSLSVALCDHHPEIIAESVKRDYELFSHGVYNTRYTYGLSVAQERQLLQEAVDTIKGASGQDVKGYLAPALSHSMQTMNLAAELGYTYTCDLFHDDQPQPVKVNTGARFVSVPYSLEMNDTIAFTVNKMTPRRYAEIIKKCFDQLYAEGAEQPKLLNIGLHCRIIGRPGRFLALERFLEHVLAHNDVWLCTRAELARYWHDNFYPH